MLLSLTHNAKTMHNMHDASHIAQYTKCDYLYRIYKNALTCCYEYVTELREYVWLGALHRLAVRADSCSGCMSIHECRQYELVTDKW